MAFSIPEDLAPELYPLAWLVGSWQGFGVIGYEGIPEQTVVSEMTFAHDGGPYLRCTATLWLADELSGPVHHEMPGAAGYAALVKDVQWSTETSYWRPIAAEQTPQGPGTQLEVVCADPAGSVSLYLGSVSGPRIALMTDAVVTSPSAARVAAASRMYGLVESDLLWVVELAAFGQPLGPYASGRVSRAEST